MIDYVSQKHIGKLVHKKQQSSMINKQKKWKKFYESSIGQSR